MTLRLPVRYLAMHSTCPDDNVEANIAPTETIYELDPREMALVLVDVWNKHPIKSHMERTARIMEEHLAPLLPLARAAGIPVIYAPSPDVAAKYPQYQRSALPQPDSPPANPQSAIRNPQSPWPPREFRRREGEYRRFTRLPGESPPGYEGPLPDWWRWDGIADSIAPEPEDEVIATGEELHRLLSARKILHLLYAGFATNICVIYRDYGMRDMGARGYMPILLRDCTSAIETRDTIADFTSTRLAIQEIERRYFSALASDCIRGLRETR